MPEGETIMAEPGARIPQESQENYQRFCAYRDLNPHRSLRETASRCGLSLSRVKQLSRKYSWDRRATIWDIFSREKRRAREQRLVREGRAALLQEAADWQQLARAEMARWVKRGPDGELELTGELSPAEILRLWGVGWEAERQLMGYGARPATPRQSSVDTQSEIVSLGGQLVRDATDYLLSLGARPGNLYRLVIPILDFIESTVTQREKVERGE